MFQFPLGQVVATQGAVELLETHQVSVSQLLIRHARGDWGNIPLEDRRANQHALQSGGRLLSSYLLGEVGSASTLWIITEADRSVTTLLRPDEY